MRHYPCGPLFAFAAALTLLAGCQGNTNSAADTGANSQAAPTDTTLAPSPADGITAAGIAEHIKVLASDDFQGRKPFTPGEEKTTAYLAAEFQKLGLRPGPEGSYFQQVPLVEITGTPSATLAVTGKGAPLKLSYFTDFVAFTQQEKPLVALSNSPLVFAGYGVVAPEYGWDDYAGLDVKGKTVVVLINDPGNAGPDTTRFQGKAMTYYGRWGYKYEEAARHGAAGVLIVHDTQPAAYPWSVVQSSYSAGARLRPQTPDHGASMCAVEGWITLDAAKKLFSAAGQDYQKLYAAANRPGFRGVPLGLSVSGRVTNTLRTRTSKNVVGVLPGTSRATDYIIYSAHWDHLGIGAPINGDSIHNGAVDNASGVAGILAIAKGFAEAKTKPARSIVFLAVTGEEQGLLGSAYYAAHPLFQPAKTVANINIDGLSTYGPMRDLTITGFGQSEMDDYARAEARQQGRYVQPDQHPEHGYFYRSDHFNFAKIGVPALYAKGQFDSRARGKAYAEAQFQAYRAQRYHQPADEYSPSWDLRGAEQDARLLFHIGQKIAAETTFPMWKSGSEFKAIREKSLAGK